MDANDEKINNVLQFAHRLIEDNNYAADKINKKAENINERSVAAHLTIVVFPTCFINLFAAINKIIQLNKFHREDI